MKDDIDKDSEYIENMSQRSHRVLKRVKSVKKRAKGLTPRFTEAANKIGQNHPWELEQIEKEKRQT